MSTFTCPLVSIKLQPHPNADSLSVVLVGGWSVVVKTEEFKNETHAVHIMPDSVADAKHPLLGFLNGERVKVCKLRKVISHGLMLPFSKVQEFMRSTLGMQEESIAKMSVEGKDFAGLLRIKRWRDPRLLSKMPNEETPIEGFFKYTDIEHYERFLQHVPFGTDVVITEKLHGANMRIGYVGEELVLGTRNLRIKFEDENPSSTWAFAAKNQNLKEVMASLKDLLKPKQSLLLFGEVVGPKVQDLKYGCTEPTFFAFDLMVDGEYLPPLEFQKIVKPLNLKTVPVLHTGPFQQDQLELRKGSSQLDSSHVREGIVITPVINKFEIDLGRVILKVISEDYATRLNPEDRRDISGE